jgi:ADP-L-glycero-D-manno-heptose 6-epimerase
MKILVTGHRGFIGQNLVYYFLGKGHKVDGFDWVPNIIPDVTRYDWIIHLGAISDTTEKDVDKVWAQNFEFTSRLIQVCDQYGVNLQYASTSAVYGPGYDGFREDSKCLPQTPYAWSKYLIDKSIRDVGVDNFQCTIQGFRYYNVFGPGEGHKGDQMSMVSKWQNQASTKKEITVFENSDTFHRDLICVYDICKIHEKMIEKDVSGIFNCGTSKASNLDSIAKTIANRLDAKIKYIPMPAHLQGQYQVYTEADMTKIQEHIELPKFWSVEEYLNDTNIRRSA